MRAKTWAVIGAGNGGQAFAGHLALLGQKVRIYDIVPETVAALNQKGGIELVHALTGWGEIEFATTDIEKAVKGADIITVVLPSLYHESITKELALYLCDGQVLYYHPEASCGGIAARKLLKDVGCKADIVIGVATTLLYSARIVEHGKVYIFGLKRVLHSAAIPACDNDKLRDAICDVIPQVEIVENVLITSLLNLNALVHPAPMLLNVSRLEADPYVPFQYYLDGITPSIGRYIEYMDEERIEIAKAFGYKLWSIRHTYVSMYEGCGDENTPMQLICKQNPGYKGIAAGNSLRTRYVLEDVPYSLVPTQALAEVAGVRTPCIDAIVGLAQNMLRGEMDIGRTGEALGIKGITKRELLKMINGDKA